jgi:hypothetical protein
MVRGLGLTETIPGPLIMVVQFVAFLGAYAAPGPLTPWVAGVVTSLLVTWVTFVPSFLFIFLGAPYIGRLRGNCSLAGALTGITAAVVGVIANLAVYFAINTLFAHLDRGRRPAGSAPARPRHPAPGPARHRHPCRGPRPGAPLARAPRPRHQRGVRLDVRPRRPPCLTSPDRVHSGFTQVLLTVTSRSLCEIDGCVLVLGA